MIVKVHPEGEIRTGLPIIVTISEVEQKPQVIVREMGKVPVEKRGEKYEAQFWAQSPGPYTVAIRAESGDSRLIGLTVEKQQFLSFTNQFGIFMALFVLAMGGLITWLIKSKRKQSLKS